jgi:undecaprenyl-diphosphatase
LESLQVVILALIQGVTEFLPISSSAHLILPAALTDWPDQGLAFDVAVHAGSLVAVMWYFRSELQLYLVSSGTFLRYRRVDEPFEEMLKIGVATLPIVIVGFLFRDVIAAELRSVGVIATTTIGFGLVLYVADRSRGQGQKLTYPAAILIGLAQVLALVPGTSRSGIAITAALFLGLNRTRAAEISFLLSIPTIAGAAFLMLLDLREAPEPVSWSTLATGSIVAAMSAYLCIRSFVSLVERTGMLPYVVYRLLLGGLLLYLLFA